MICSSCGTQNDSGQKFCLECGTPLAVACPNCGTPNPPRAKFCGECATALAGAAPAAGVGAPPAAVSSTQAERRLVTVLFADLVGFTPFSEGRDAEDVRETLSRYFELARDVIGRYGGTVEKFIGDAVMAVWGAPVAREDDAERAVRAALDLVAGVPALAPGLLARAGVLTGEAAVDLRATDQGLVAGDLVNTASRLQAVAPPGAVLVGDATHRAASSSIAFEEAGDHVLKGKVAPVAAWRALRVVSNRRGEGRSDLPEPPFVGRDEEVRVLRDQLSASTRDPRVRVVSITGPGGIGKSRLAWEFEKYVDGLVEDVYWHRGRSPSYGEGITFWALGEMVRQRAGLAESDDEATTRARITATVEEFVPVAEDRRWVEPALLALLGVEAPPAGGRDMLFAAWRIFFERIAARGTTVLLFEDLQWADSGLLDFIDHLLEWAKGVPIIVVTLARPELFDRRPTWGAGTRNFTALALEPLADAEMRVLLDGFVPGLPRDAVEAILARADGMPLYAVETVRALVAEGRLRQVDGAYQPVGVLGSLSIPETLQSLIASRLDGLDAADRALMQDAAVLGQSFSPTALSVVSGLAAGELEPRLRGLVRRELLELRADPRSPERGQYAFVQSLIREVAYATLARRDRRTRHLAVARHFESLGDDELAGALATHYLAAYRASAEGPEAEAVAIQARLALRGAATRAAGLGAHDQAIVFLQQALDVTTDPGERAELLIPAATSAAAAADYERAKDLAQRAVDERSRAGDRVGVAEARAVLGHVLIEGSRVQEALAALKAALADTPEAGADEVRAQVLTNLSRALMRGGDFSGAIETADRALSLAERLNLEVLVAEAFNNKSAALSNFGRFREATALMEAAIRAAAAGGFVSAELRARNNLASITWENDPRRTMNLSWEAYELARRLGNRAHANWALSFIGAAHWYAGLEWDRAEAALAEAIAALPEPSERWRLVSTLTLLTAERGENTDEEMAILETAASEVSDPSAPASMHQLRSDRAWLAGDFPTAHREMYQATRQEGMKGIYLPLAIRPALWAGDAALVRRWAAELDAMAEAAQPVNRANRTLAWAGVAALEGRRAEALAGYRDAFRQYRDFGYDFEFARSVVDALHVLGPEDPELRRAADEAREVFERIRATPSLQRLDEALAEEQARPRAAPAASPSVEAGR